MLTKWEGKREIARMLQRLGGSRAIKHWSGAQDNMSAELCSPSRACDMEEVSTSEASWTAVTKGKEKKVWRLEPEGEAEKPEVTVLWNEAEGVSVNPEGESHHERTRAKMARKERKNQTNM